MIAATTLALTHAAIQGLIFSPVACPRGIALDAATLLTIGSSRSGIVYVANSVTTKSPATNAAFVSQLEVDRWTRDLKLEDNWDGEGAPAPSDESVTETKRLIVWLLANSLVIEGVAPDVLGGSGIYLDGVRPGTDAWIAVLNEGRRSVVLEDNGRISSRTLDEQALLWMKAFLIDGSNG